MPLPSSINDLSTTASANSPAGSESPGLIDDYLRTYASYIAQLRDRTGRMIGVQVFSTAGSFTYTPTAGTAFVVVEVQGAGGSGGGTPATGAGIAAIASGGGSGSYANQRFTSSFSGVTVTVGAGGLSPAAGANPGNAGGASSFGALLTAAGGGGGSAGSSSGTFPYAGGIGAGGTVPSGGIVNYGGKQSSQPIALAAAQIVASYGAESQFGGGGLAFPTSGNGTGGRGAGAGGGGACAGQSLSAFFGGVGADGKVVVWEYA